jgi:hypothetical protein
VARFKVLLQFAEWVLVFVLTLLTATRNVDPEDQEQPIRAVLTFIHGKLFTYIFWTALSILVVKVVNAVIQHKTGRSDTIQNVLNSLHKQYFSGVPENELFQHRATLFKAKKFFSLRPNYLQVFARSGTAYQRSKTYLRIDDENENRNEGIAGKAWFINASASVYDLPSWPETWSSGTDFARRKEYAERGLLSVEKAASLNVKSRSITATVVRTATGRKWGVLVLDSRDPAGILNVPEKKALAELSAEIMRNMV